MVNQIHNLARIFFETDWEAVHRSLTGLVTADKTSSLRAQARAGRYCKFFSTGSNSSGLQTHSLGRRNSSES